MVNNPGSKMGINNKFAVNIHGSRYVASGTLYSVVVVCTATLLLPGLSTSNIVISEITVNIKRVCN